MNFTDKEKAQYLDARARLDANHPRVLALARRFADAYGHGTEACARAIHAWVRDSIAYREDRGPNGARAEELADAATVLRRGYDDCDGKSALCVSLLLAAGLDARIRAIFPRETGTFDHVQIAMRWPGSKTDPAATPGGWVPAETIIAGVDPGQDPETGRREAGRLMLAGPRTTGGR